MPFDLKSWLKQPSTIAGVATFAGTVIYTTGQAAAHQISWPVAAGGIAAAAVMMAIPDNTAAQADARKLAVDAATAVLTKRIAVMAPELFGDARAIAVDLSAHPIVPNPATIPVSTVG